MKKIIVPIDFSDTAGNALKYACYLADVTGYDLEAIHVHDGYDGNAELVIKKGSARVRSRVRERVEKFVAEHTDHTTFTGTPGINGTLPLIKVREEIGTAIGVLTKQSQREDAGLIVMGGVGSGNTGPSSPIMGSVARSLSLNASCPVMLIPANAGIPEINSAAITFDNADSLMEISDKSKNIRTGLNLKMHFTHVQDPDPMLEEIKEIGLLRKVFREAFPDYDVEYDLLPAGDVANVLLEYVMQTDIDLLVLGRRQRGPLKRLFIASTIYPIVSECGIPMLVIPIKDY